MVLISTLLPCPLVGKRTLVLAALLPFPRTTKATVTATAAGSFWSILVSARGLSTAFRNVMDGKWLGKWGGQSLSKVSREQGWAKAVREADLLVQVDGGLTSTVDARKLAGSGLSKLTDNIGRLIGSGHPMLTTINKYYFSQEGKHIRPLIVLLMSQATSLAPKSTRVRATDNFELIDTPVSAAFRTDSNWVGQETKGTDRLLERTHRVDHPDYTPLITKDGCTILPTQRRLAEITEMIHTASLLHDDVIDDSSMRRNQTTANAQFGNKMAILAGDFLLARASVALARLRDVEVNELMATVIANLVEGEFMQLRNTKEGKSTFEYYMEKTYLKTASLIAKSCRSTALLNGSTADVCDIAYEYGKNIGLAFQLVDDMLDLTVTEKDCGKPVGADLKLGLATAPVLFAWEECPELGKLIERKFSKAGDVDKARHIVTQSNGIQQTKILAASHCQKAISAITLLPPSESRTALMQITHTVLQRER